MVTLVQITLSVVRIIWELNMHVGWDSKSEHHHFNLR